jgi:hypothetical protein
MLTTKRAFKEGSISCLQIVQLQLSYRENVWQGTIIGRKSGVLQTKVTKLGTHQRLSTEKGAEL